MSGSACHDGPFNNHSSNNDEPTLHKSGSTVDVNNQQTASDPAQPQSQDSAVDIVVPCGDIHSNTDASALAVTATSPSGDAGGACTSTSTSTFPADEPMVSHPDVSAPTRAPVPKEMTIVVPVVASTANKKKIRPGRCGVCRKKIGLTGFKCQCEIFFCAAHRMPEAHECDFDFKTSGRERLASANVAMVADKLVKI